MIEIRIADTVWFGISRVFPTGGEARQAFTTLGGYDGSGRLNVGVYRHQRVGLDQEPVLVSIIGVEREKVEEAGSLIGGKEIEQHPDTWLALAARRARVVLSLSRQGKKSGRYEIEHGPGGDQLDPDGRFR